VSQEEEIIGFDSLVGIQEEIKGYDSLGGSQEGPRLMKDNGEMLSWTLLNWLDWT
jgi:hypothetical protein